MRKEIGLGIYKILTFTKTWNFDD